MRSKQMRIIGTGISFQDPDEATRLGFEGCDMQAELLPANLRRRTSVATKTAFAAAERACRRAGVAPAELPTIFISAIGEIDVTDKLCSDIAHGRFPLSPTRFHNSVHNTASGYWSIAVGSGHPAMAMAGYQDSFALGLLEAGCQLQSITRQVLLVCFEEKPPQVLLPDHGWLGAAVAFVLSAGEGKGCAISRPFAVQKNGSDAEFHLASPALAAMELLRAAEEKRAGTIRISPPGATEWLTELSLA